MSFFRIREFLRGCMACLISAVALLAVWCASVDRFHGLDGQRVFYAYSPSSQAQRLSSLRLCDFDDVTGESVAFPRDGQTEEEILEKIKGLYGMEIAFTERVGKTVSYYGYTERWTDGVRINGKFINMHVAIGEENCAVGSPLIFGGF